MTEQEVTEQEVPEQAAEGLSEDAVNDEASGASPEDAEDASAEKSPESNRDEEADPESDADVYGIVGEDGVIKYDFTRPWMISKKFHQNLSSIAESFANQLSFTLSNYLRTNVDVTYQSVTQVLFNDYLKQLPERKCIGVMGILPLKGQSVINVDGRMMFVILDKLIGGTGSAHEIGREFTEIEIKIFTHVMGRILGDFGEAAKKFFDSTVTLSRIENNPAFIAIMTGGERVIVMSLEMVIGENNGSILIAIPMTGFEPVMDALDPKENILVDQQEIPPEDRVKVISVLNETNVEIIAEIGSTQITLKEFLKMEVGDELVLKHRVGKPIALKVGNTTVCYGEPGKSQNHKAVQVVSE